MRANPRDEWFHAAGKLGLSISEAERLLALGRKLRRLAELRCNGSPARRIAESYQPGSTRDTLLAGAEKDEARYEREWKRTSKLAADYVQAQEMGYSKSSRPAFRRPEAAWRVQVDGDPRGPVLRLVLADGREVCVA